MDGFRQNNSHGLLELIKLYKQNSLEKSFIFTIYQNYTLALRLKYMKIMACTWEPHSLHAKKYGYIKSNYSYV